MEFEHDIQKSEANRIKHGISLEEAQILGSFPGVEFAAKSHGEPRFLRVSCLNGKFYSCFFTLRESRIRLVSARRSRLNEKWLYEEEMKRNEKKEKGFDELRGS